VQGAQVTLTNTDQGLALQTQTNGSGIYVFSPVKIGNYTISATAANFETQKQENLHLSLQQRLNVNLTLKPGSTTQTITVSTAPPALQTEEASTGQVVDAQAINNTPLNGRNWVFIAQLASGVAPPVGARGAGTGDFSANGQRWNQNNFVLDGVDNNAYTVDYMNNATYNVQPPPDALQEFKIQTGDYSAEFGHSAGGVVNASIKSGTNNFHGSLWEYARNDAFNTKQYWDTPTTKIAEYRQNLFGGTLGGPILKNRLFFFGDAQGDRIINGKNEIITVPSVLERQGNFSELLSSSQTGGSPIYLYNYQSGGGPSPTVPGSTLATASPYQMHCANTSTNGVDTLNVVCPGQINAVAQKVLNLYPLPNRTNTSGGLLNNNYTQPVNTVDITSQFDARIDYNISSKDQTFVRYSYGHEFQFYPPPLGMQLGGGSSSTDGYHSNIGENFAFSETHAFSASFLNEFRLGYNYGQFGKVQAVSNDSGVPASMGIGGVPSGLPYVSISGISGFGTPGYVPEQEHENVPEVLDNITKVIGKHSLRAGFSFQEIRFATLQTPDPRGAYTYNGSISSAYGISNTGFGAADFIGDEQASGGISSFTVMNDVRWDRAVYIQDDWKATRKLTVNLGLRLENQTPYYEAHGLQAEFMPTGPTTFDPTVGNQGKASATGTYLIPSKSKGVTIPAAFLSVLASNNISLQYSDNPYLINYQRFDWAPRVGLSYELDDKTVVRAGAGIYYGGMESSGGAPNLGQNYPFIVTANIYNPGNVSCTYADGCPTDGMNLATGFSSFLSNGGLLGYVKNLGLNGVQQNMRTSYAEQLNLAVQRALPWNLVADVAYVGAFGRHMLDYPNGVNGPPVVTPYCNSLGVGGTPTNKPCGTGSSQNPFSNFSPRYQLNDGITSYNSLQAKAEKHYSDNLSFLGTYTWSHALEDATSSIESNDNYSGGPGTPNYVIFGTRKGYATGNEDVRQRFTFTESYILPLGKGQRLFNQNTALDYLVGGWQESLVYQAQAGEPFTVGTANFSGVNNLSQRAIRIGDPFKGGGTPDPSLNWAANATCPTSVRNVTNWFNPCAFKNPLPGTAVTGVLSTAAAVAPYLGDNADNLVGPGYSQINMSLFKSFATFREERLQFRVDVFNLFNSPTFGQPVGNDGVGGALISAGNYRFTQNNAPDSRFFQFALKYSY
jgi:hypothetical protein